MKKVRVVLIIALFFILTSCNTSSTYPSQTQIKLPEVLSPFKQFETIKSKEISIDGEQVDNILRSYFIYDEILEKITEDAYYDSSYYDVKVDGYNIGPQKVAVMLIDKGHLYIYILFSNSNDKWIVSGFTYQNERYKPEYRIEHASDGSNYWLVVKHEANRGTGVSIFNEIWFNPDGTVAAEFPLEGSTLFFPEVIEPAPYAYFSTSAYYNGDSTIALSYSISFKYGYEERLQSEYRPVIREYWEFDLQTQQLKFVSCEPSLPESLRTMKQEVSSEYGILQGYIDFYRTRLGDRKIFTLAEWENLMVLTD